MLVESQELFQLVFSIGEVSLKIAKGKRLDFTIGDVNAVYDGPAGVLWRC